MSETSFIHRDICCFIYEKYMDGKIKLGIAILALAVISGAFLLSVSVTQADTAEPLDTGGEEIDEKPYATCGGIQGCRSSCGCGCAGNPSACGCGG